MALFYMLGMLLITSETYISPTQVLNGENFRRVFKALLPLHAGLAVSYIWIDALCYILIDSE
jgi:hypothetical protein